MHLSHFIRACCPWGVPWCLMSENDRVAIQVPRPYPKNGRKNNCVLTYPLGCLHVCLWWLAADLKVKLAASKLTTLRVNPRYELMQAFGLSCSAAARSSLLICSSNRQTAHQGAHVSECYVLDLAGYSARFGRAVEEFVLLWLLAVIFHPPPEVQQLFARCVQCQLACVVGMLTHVKQVNRVTNPLFLRCSNWSGSPNPPHHPWALN